VATLPAVASYARGNAPISQRLRSVLTTHGTAYEGFFNVVSARYFETLEIPIVRGRTFTDAEAHSAAKVVVVSAATARTLWPGRDPIGELVDVEASGRARLTNAMTPGASVVIGVARDAQMTNLGQIPPVYAYVPGESGSLIVHAAGVPSVTATQIRDAARSLDANVLVTATPIEELGAMINAVLGVQLAAKFAGAVGMLALVLTAIGLFGLVAYSVSRRTRELGIRRALGAKSSDVIALVLRDGFRAVLIGGAIGIAAGAAGSRLLSSLLFGMSPLDPLAFGGVVVAMVVVALVACYVPARRAIRIDPLLALKTE
jgi:hypothetical protein